MTVFQPASMSAEEALNSMVPAQSAVEVTFAEEDTEDFDLKRNGKLPRNLYIGGTGDLSVVHVGDVNDIGDDENREIVVTYKNVPIGFFPGVFAKIKKETTATDIVAMY